MMSGGDEGFTSRMTVGVVFCSVGRVVLAWPEED